ncbi:hypothetical protein [Caldalkalibacillus mannanilyticus]|uniref:hypothetical protein n=1 Tax=Caldalkalibacillus mannanilyticus TaxID=1418 RepID=UPI000AAE2400|nr:hypothetical protein [Caldalkalibacillus mannanilyticus]
MKKATTHSKSLTAEQQIMTDLINALIAERFLLIHEDTIKELSQAPLEVQQLYFTQLGRMRQSGCIQMNYAFCCKKDVDKATSGSPSRLFIKGKRTSG